MHIPAIDSLRHERIGMITGQDGDVSMLVQAHVETEETNERGAYDPIEGMSRPFPYMLYSKDVVAVEPLVDNGELEELSDAIVEYISYLYDSVHEGEWVDELDEFEEERLTEQEERLASELLDYTAHEPPRTLWRLLYEESNKLKENDFELEQNLLQNNPLRDIEGRDRYGFDFLPSIDTVDSWELKHSTLREEYEDDPIEYESLWVRYENGDVTEERPLLSYQNGNLGYVAQSPSVSYGEEDMDSVPDALVEAILNGNDEFDSNLTGVSQSSLAGTRTLEYLENY